MTAEIADLKKSLKVALSPPSRLLLQSKLLGRLNIRSAVFYLRHMIQRIYSNEPLNENERVEMLEELDSLGVQLRDAALDWRHRGEVVESDGIPVLSDLTRSEFWKQAEPELRQETRESRAKLRERVRKFVAIPPGLDEKTAEELSAKLSVNGVDIGAGTGGVVSVLRLNEEDSIALLGSGSGGEGMEVAVKRGGVTGLPGVGVSKEILFPTMI